ncbi:MAG TPA: hypothetical protein VM369_04950 [Candidatus Binatia bacterium]|nr:hypothetical protein [Candidatus Binatia bacterium]
MEDADFSDDFVRFLQEGVPSVQAAELLLQLAADPAAEVRPRDAAEAKILQSFHAGGLAMASVDQAYQYRPANETLQTHVQTLAKAYEERPVTLIRIIYALRDSKIHSFADAFRVRKD